MSYTIIDRATAVELMEQLSDDAEPILVPEYNQACVYQLPDGRFIVQALNPFGNNLLVTSLQEIKEFDKQQYFPDGDEQSGIYVENKTLLDSPDFFAGKEIRKAELISYITKSKSQYAKDVDFENLDNVFKFMRKVNKLKQYKFHLLLTVGDYLINKYGNGNLRWALTKEKFYLNPYRQLVIVHKKDSSRYFSVENSLFGKWGFLGMQMMEYRFTKNTFHRVQPPLDEVYKVFSKSSGND